MLKKLTFVFRRLLDLPVLRLILPTSKWRALASLGLSAILVSFLRLTGVGTGKNLAGIEDGCLALLVLIILLWMVPVLRRWTREMYLLSPAENASIALAMGLVASTLAGFADYNLYLLRENEYLVDEGFKNVLVNSERQYDQSILARERDNLLKWSYFLEDLSSPKGVTSAADTEQSSNADAGEKEKKQIIYLTDSSAITYVSTYVYAKPAGDAAPHREYREKLEFLNLKTNSPLPLNVNAACSEPLGKDIRNSSRVVLALQKEVQCQIDRTNAIIKSYRSRADALSPETAYVPSYTFVQEWTMDFCGSRPMLIRPIGPRSRLLAACFDLLKIYFYFVLFQVAAGLISTKATKQASKEGQSGCE